MSFLIVLSLLVFGLSSCKWKWKPTYPASRIADSLRQMCSRDYRLTVESRYESKTLQALVWKVGLFGGGRSYDLQAMRKEAVGAMEHVFLCATRITLSTDAPLDFIEVKIADVLTGATVTLWRYVPDIRDSMYTRIAEEEYFNRLVVEVHTESRQPLSRQGIQWDRPLTLREFLAKQVVLRAKRQSPVGLQAHEDLSKPSTLTVVIDNWSAIEKEEPQHKAKIADTVEKAARAVLMGYRFNGFRGLALQDGRGAALRSWTL